MHRKKTHNQLAGAQHTRRGAKGKKARVQRVAEFDTKRKVEQFRDGHIEGLDYDKNIFHKGEK
jgi:hypothetical protein